LGKPVKGGVGGKRKNEQGGNLQTPKSRASITKNVLSDLCQDSDSAVWNHPKHPGHRANTPEQECENDAKGHQGSACIAGCRFLEEFHAIGDGFDACEG
jgi:hypothetical protein